MPHSTPLLPDSTHNLTPPHLCPVTGALQPGVLCQAMDEMLSASSGVGVVYLKVDTVTWFPAYYGHGQIDVLLGKVAPLLRHDGAQVGRFGHSGFGCLLPPHVDVATYANTVMRDVRELLDGYETREFHDLVRHIHQLRCARALRYGRPEPPAPPSGSVLSVTVAAVFVPSLDGRHGSQVLRELSELVVKAEADGGNVVLMPPR